MRIDIPDQSRVIARCGETEQTCQCLEELAELSQAVSKMHRMKNQDSGIVGVYYNLVEEMADVLIMIQQMKLIYGIEDHEIQTMVNRKWARQMKRMQIP